MTRRILLFLMLFFGVYAFAKAQYRFSGNVNKTKWQGEVYLSLVDDYRKISSIDPQQIIHRVPTDSLGNFLLEGNNLPLGEHMYKLHVDNCRDTPGTAMHYLGHCEQSIEVSFIAGPQTTIHFPATFDNQTFCSIRTASERSNALLKIDSLKEIYAYDMSAAASATAIKLEAKKWIARFQEQAQQLQHPLAQLYTYAFISKRDGALYPYYLEDLKDNEFYTDLENTLLENYPEETFTTQYRNELIADRSIIGETKNSNSTLWIYAVVVLAIASITLNLFLFKKSKKRPVPKGSLQSSLTAQEQKIVAAILEDKSNKEIAAQMYVSLSTVKTHINNIYKKLHISSRDELKGMS